MGTGTQAAFLLPSIPILTSPAMCAWRSSLIHLSHGFPYLCVFLMLIASITIPIIALYIRH